MPPAWTLAAHAVPVVVGAPAEGQAEVGESRTMLLWPSPLACYYCSARYCVLAVR